MAPLPQPRAGMQAVYEPSSDTIVVAGGYGANGIPVATTFVYLIAANTWVTGPSLIHPRSYSVLTRNDVSGDLYVVGADLGTSGVGTAERLTGSPLTSTWTLLPNPPVGFGKGVAAASSAGALYVMGGEATTSSVAAYQPSSNTWATCGNLALARAGGGAVRDSTGQILLLGGWGPGVSQAADVQVAMGPAGPLASTLMAFPAIQALPANGIYALQIVGPPGAQVALLADATPTNLPVPPHGTLGVGLPPMLTFDGIGLGLPNTTPMSLTIPASGVYYFSFPLLGGVPPGVTAYVQAVAMHPSFPPVPGFAGMMLSTHGSAALPTPACRASVVPSDDVTLADFSPADANYVDASLAPTLSSWQGGKDIDHSVSDLGRSPTFSYQSGAGSSPVAWAKFRNGTLSARSVKLEYSVWGFPGATVAFSTGTSAFTVPAGTIASGGIGVDPTYQEAQEGTPSGFPNLSSLPPGTYSISARLLLEYPAGSQSYVPTGSVVTRGFRVSSATPVVLVHGICGDAGTFGDLEALLENDATSAMPVRRFLYKSEDGTTQGLAGKAGELATFVSQTGYTSCNFVMHSMGGLVVRKFLMDFAPPSSIGGRLVFLGTPHFGASIATLVPSLPSWLGCLLSAGGSAVVADLTPASLATVSLANDWPAASSNRATLNLIGTATPSLPSFVSDGVVRVDEAKLPIGSGPTMNVYVYEKHSGAVPLVGVDAIANYPLATGSVRAGYYLMRALLVSTSANPLLDVATAAATPPASITTFSATAPANATSDGTLWIPYDPATVSVFLPASGLFSTVWDNPESHTFVWSDISATVPEEMCSNMALPNCFLGLTLSVPLPGSLVIGGQTRRCQLVSGGGTVIPVADTSHYPY